MILNPCGDFLKCVEAFLCTLRNELLCELFVRDGSRGLAGIGADKGIDLVTYGFDLLVGVLLRALDGVLGRSVASSTDECRLHTISGTSGVVSVSVGESGGTETMHSDVDAVELDSTVLGALNTGVGDGDGIPDIGPRGRVLSLRLELEGVIVNLYDLEQCIGVLDGRVDVVLEPGDLVSCIARLLGCFRPCVDITGVSGYIVELGEFLWCRSPILIRTVGSFWVTPLFAGTTTTAASPARITGLFFCQLASVSYLSLSLVLRVVVAILLFLP